MKPKPPNREQQRVLGALRTLIRKNHRVPPTLREIGDKLKLHHTTVLQHLQSLHALGLVDKHEGKGRIYTVSAKADKYLPRTKR